MLIFDEVQRRFCIIIRPYISSCFLTELGPARSRMAVAPSEVSRPAKGQGKHKQRKLKSKSKSAAKPSSSSKKYRSVPAAQLPWRASKNANYDFDDFAAGEGGMLELEEIDDVDVVWEERPDGSKTVKFKVRLPVVGHAAKRCRQKKLRSGVLMAAIAGERRAARAEGRSR